MKKLFLLALIITTVPSYAAIGELQGDLSASEGEIGFNAIGNPSALRINGKTALPNSALQGKMLLSDTEKSLTLSVSFDLDSLTTGMGMRDRHMKKKYLETKKFSQAKFTLSKIDLPAAFYDGTTTNFDAVPFSGKFEVHGVVKEIQGKINLERSEGAVDFKAKFNLDIANYGINIPSFMGITMVNKVDVYFTAKAGMKSP